MQADILKEDQGQNTCLFSTEFSLRMMADIQEWFIQHQVRNFYSVSISGYHIAEAGANPISQLAFTLANGFTYVEAYLARGMDIDDFAPNLSFFFSNGMDPEYSVLGRVARRIWAITMKEKYGANERSQKLKYHVQTSGRSLHAQEMDFNDIRTTLQALIAIYDNANSLHTNAYDEAVTTPTEESVRRALAIQLIINREWGLAMNENPLQGSFIIDELTDLVEEAVLAEFDRINERGGVLGAMETGYQRGRIQDESMLYEHRKHDGILPIIGVNTFVKPDTDVSPTEVELARATEEEKESQLRRVRDFQAAHAAEAEAALAAAQGGGDGRGQRLRRPHGRRARLLAPAGHRGVLRGRRAVPAQRVTRRRRRGHRDAQVPRRDAPPDARQRLPHRRVDMDCHFESICEGCTFFLTTIDFRPTIRRHREDAANKANMGQVAEPRSLTASLTGSTTTLSTTEDLPLQGGEERLGGGIVETGSDSAHRLADPKLSAQLGERVRGVGRAAVAVKDDPLGLVLAPDRRLSTTSSHGHLDRRARQLGVWMQPSGSTEQPARVQVDHGRQVQLRAATVGTGGDLGHILCRPPDYADVPDDRLWWCGFRVRVVGIVRGLRARRGCRARGGRPLVLRGVVWFGRGLLV